MKTGAIISTLIVLNRSLRSLDPLYIIRSALWEPAHSYIRLVSSLLACYNNLLTLNIDYCTVSRVLQLVHETTLCESSSSVFDAPSGFNV